MSVFVALTVKQVPFELRTVDLAAAAHLAPAFADLSRTRRLPTLVHGRLVLGGDAVPARLADYAARQRAHPAVRRWVDLERPPL
jgi:glutathione S-transferase